MPRWCVRVGWPSRLTLRSFLPTNCHPLSLGGSTPPPRLVSWTQATSICSFCRNLRSSTWRDLSPARLSWRRQNVYDGACDGPEDGIAEVDDSVGWRLVAEEIGASGWRGIWICKETRVGKKTKSSKYEQMPPDYNMKQKITWTPLRFQQLVTNTDKRCSKTSTKKQHKPQCQLHTIVNVKWQILQIKTADLQYDNNWQNKTTQTSAGNHHHLYSLGFHFQTPGSMVNGKMQECRYVDVAKGTVQRKFTEKICRCNGK